MENNLKIQVLGSGCPTCKKFYDLVKKTVAKMNLNAEVEYIDDVKKIIDLGLLQSPVLIINNKPVLTGYTSDKEKIKNLISQSLDKKPTIDSKIIENNKNSGGCSCGGNC
jgi:small redox-active disulfide protein 2